MEMFEAAIVAQPKWPVGPAEEGFELDLGRHCRRAAMARHDDRAAGIGKPAAVLDRLAAQPAATGIRP